MLYEDLEKITTNSKYVTRHIVPFGFSPNGDVKEYDKIFGKLKKPGESCFVLCP